MQRTRPHAMRVSSMIQLTKKVLTEDDFRTYLRAHSVTPHVLACVQDAPTVPEVAIPACAVLLALHAHARRTTDSAVRVLHLLLRVLSGCRAAAAGSASHASPGRERGGGGGGGLGSAGNSAVVRRKLLLQRRQETKAKDMVLRALQLARPVLMFPFASPAAVTVQALALECLSLLLRVMDEAALAEAHAELRVLGGLDTLVDTVHDAVQACMPTDTTASLRASPALGTYRG